MRSGIALLAVILIVAPRVAIGASFNCSKARTTVEKSICANKDLSSLDEELARAYELVISSSGNSDVAKREQQDWLHNVRDKCQDITCLKDAYTNRLAQLATDTQVEWKTFHDSNVGIEFSYPGNRKVKVGCHESKNCVALIGKLTSHSDYLIAFQVFDGDLDTVAVEQAVFQKQNSGWIAKGRFGKHPVVPLAGPGWQGIKSIVDCGISDNSGFHAGAGECMWVVLSNGKRSVVADTQGIVGMDQESMCSIQSIRFIK